MKLQQIPDTVTRLINISLIVLLDKNSFNAYLLERYLSSTPYLNYYFK